MTRIQVVQVVFYVFIPVVSIVGGVLLIRWVRDFIADGWRATTRVDRQQLRELVCRHQWGCCTKETDTTVVVYPHHRKCKRCGRVEVDPDHYAGLIQMKRDIDKNTKGFKPDEPIIMDEASYRRFRSCTCQGPICMCKDKA